MKRSLVVRGCMAAVILFVVSLFLGSMAFAENNSGQGTIDLNTATVQELTALPGIGKKKAQSIIDYRAENGKFESVDEIRRIDGIGKKLFSKISDRIVVE